MPFEGDVLGWRGTFCDVELLFFPWLDGICILQAAQECLNSQCRAGQEVKQPLCAMLRTLTGPRLWQSQGFSTLPIPDP